MCEDDYIVQLNFFKLLLLKKQNNNKCRANCL
jgi:hypothetical protein